jgi:hypothetical protein
MMAPAAKSISIFMNITRHLNLEHSLRMCLSLGSTFAPLGSELISFIPKGSVFLVNMHLFRCGCCIYSFKVKTENDSTKDTLPRVYPKSQL